MADGFSKQSVPPSESSVSLSVRNMFGPARLSLVNALQTRADAVAAAVSKTSAEYRFRVIVSAVLAGSGLMLTAASLHQVRRAEVTIATQQRTVLQRDLLLVRSAVQGLGASIDGIRGSNYGNQEAITTAQRNLILIRGALTTNNNRLQTLERQTSGNQALRNDWLALSGLINRLQMDIIALQGVLSGAERDLISARERRTQLVQDNSLALAAAEQRARRLPCDYDALQAACNGPLHGITCYQFPPADPRRVQCDIVKTLCRECNLP